MSFTRTPRLGLYKSVPGSGEIWNQGEENADKDKIDLNIGSFVCTSSTRPSSPFTGQKIFETDTKAKGVWDGTRWLMYDSMYQDYNPTWIAATGTPAPGTGGEIDGRYFRMGRNVRVLFGLSFGSTAIVPGTGLWQWDTPTPQANWHITPVALNMVGSAWYRQGAATAWILGSVHLSSPGSAAKFTILPNGATEGLGAGSGLVAFGRVAAEFEYEMQ